MFHLPDFACVLGQGIKWITSKESSPDRNLEVVRLGQPDMLRKLERALENGYALHSIPEFHSSIWSFTACLSGNACQGGPLMTVPGDIGVPVTSIGNVGVSLEDLT